jgi:hypothetical protein
MPGTIGDLSVDDLRRMIGEAVEEKLQELLADPDQELLLREDVVARLREQQSGTAAGERGTDFQAVLSQLDLS